MTIQAERAARQEQQAAAPAGPPPARAGRTIRAALQRSPWLIFAAVTMVIGAVFIILPQINTIATAFRTSTGWGLDAFVTFFSSSQYTAAIGNSLLVVFSTAGIATVLAVPLAYLFARYDFTGKNVALTFITLATASPPFLGAYAWLILLGRFGVVHNIVQDLFHVDLDLHIIGPAGVIWVVTWLVFPLVFLLSFEGFTNQDPSLADAAASAGAHRIRTLFRVEIPLAIPGIVTGIFMAMLAAFSDFGTPAVIGGEFPVMPTLVYGQYVSEVGGNLSLASTAGLVMILMSSVALTVQRIILAKRTFATLGAKRSRTARAGRAGTIGIMVYTAVILIAAFAPHVTLVVVSFLKWNYGILSSTFTLENYTSLFTEHLAPIGVSFMVGGIATVLCAVFGVGISYLVVRKKMKFVSPFLNVTTTLPYIIPGTVLALGYVVVFNNPPLILTGTWLILVIVSFVRKLPFAIKSAEASLYQVHPAVEEAALMAGAGPGRAFLTTTLRLMMGGVLTGASLAFLQMMTELSSSLILYRPPWETMTVAIYRNALSSGADFGLSAAMGVVLLLSVNVILLTVNLVTRKNIRL
ncbi:ABC transporter permease [Leifsonia sp. NPDC102414]|uniref:ABC transporter permease n=1 Tax=Leifsonia sp. NPDC102414 TaxID=3364124 RepID=UPI00382E64D9